MRRVIVVGLTIMLLLAFGVVPAVQGDGDAPPVFVPLVCADTPFSPPGLAITALRYNTRDECVTLTNLGRKGVLLAGYRLESAPDQWYDLPAIELMPLQSVRIHSGPDAFNNPPGDLFWVYRYMWNDEGDIAWLYDPAGMLIDVWAY